MNNESAESTAKESKAILEIKSKLSKSEKELAKLKSDIPKGCLLMLGLLFVLPYIPLRNGQLIEQYGYLNSIIYIVIGYFVVIPPLYIHVRNKMINEISNLELNLEQQKRLDKLNE